MASELPCEMTMGRVFKDPFGQINSIDFHRSQDVLAAGHDGGKITIYCTNEGRKAHTLDCSKYGVAHVTFTHHSKSLLHASTQYPSADASNALQMHAIRYFSIHDQSYLRFFPSHTRQVTSIAMSSKSDQFISGGLDNKVFSWDLRTRHPQATLDVPGQPHVAMDEEGLVFAAAANGSVVSLFDARNFNHGPFLSFPMPLKTYGIPELSCVTSMKFSCQQQHLMVNVGNRIFIMDTFNGKEIIHWNTGSPDGSLPMESSFSADGRHVISGGEDRCMYIWKCPAPDAKLSTDEIQSLQVPVAVLPAHPGVPRCAKFSPTRHMAVSACHALCMWIPSPVEKVADGEVHAAQSTMSSPAPTPTAAPA